MNIQTMSEMELKALGYEFISQLEVLQNNLRAVNQELKNRVVKPEVKPEVKEEKKK